MKDTAGQTDRAVRQSMVDAVRHSTRLKGGHSSLAARELQQQYVDGTIGLDELLQRTRVLHGLTTDQESSR